MFNITLICVGKLREQFYIEAVDEYVKRLAGYCNIDVIELREQRVADAPSDAQIALALDKERVAIEAKIPASAKVAALCVEGREIDSREFSQLLYRYAERGTSRLCFIVGGSYGLHETLKNNAEIKLSLSRMTFPHTLARVILLEQLYRAFNIAEGGKYHK